MPKEYIVDSSVILKWLNSYQEENLDEARSLLKAAEIGEIFLFSSDLCVYEIFNVLVRGKQLSKKPLQEAIQDFWRFPLMLLTTDEKTSVLSANFALEQGITVYDAVFLALAFEHQMPLISSNTKHHKTSDGMTVIPLRECVI